MNRPCPLCLLQFYASSLVIGRQLAAFWYSIGKQNACNAFELSLATNLPCHFSTTIEASLPRCSWFRFTFCLCFFRQLECAAILLPYALQLPPPQETQANALASSQETLPDNELLKPTTPTLPGLSAVGTGGFLMPPGYDVLCGACIFRLFVSELVVFRL